MVERDYQAGLIKRIYERFRNHSCLVLKNDSSYIQGIPDLLVLIDNKWAFLEVKKTADERHQPNQDYYISWGMNCSFASFIFPENEEEVLNDLSRTLGFEG